MENISMCVRTRVSPQLSLATQTRSATRQTSAENHPGHDIGKSPHNANGEKLVDQFYFSILFEFPKEYFFW